MRRRRRLEPAIELTSLVDVLFLLIIFFVLTTTFAQGGVPVSLPGGSPEERAPEDVTTVTLDAAGQLYLDGDPLDTAALAGRIGGATAETTLRLRADGAVPYGRVMEVFHVLQHSGRGTVLLVVEDVD
ncbi:MAG: biopolymer transporter ExbD [Synergistales bacterium]|nr:biopolymer transporter ExbD [Synergistales bacterium]